MNHTTQSTRLYRLHTTLNALLMTPKIPSEAQARLEAAEELLNDYRDAEAQGHALPGDISARVIREIRAALPPERLAEIIANLPPKLRRMAAESLAEPPVRRVFRLVHKTPRKP